ncbi:hypothetical protein [Streptomyces sp. SudanB148_2056]|uniref:hypothetical protein n=1 Tax=Streptomyces sp. SudanB148_2056 TaxID=3035280 RepID=UPI003F57A436
MAQAVAGRATHYASIPRDIREATALSAVATFPSSFGVAMYGPSTDIGQGTLFGDLSEDHPALLDEAVEKVLNIVDLSEEAHPSDERLAEQLAPLGQRSTGHIRRLTTGLSQAGVGVRVSWHARSGTVRQSEWSPAGLRRVRLLCERSNFTEAETITVIGWLGSASSFHGIVEIQTDGGEKIRASTDEELTAQLDRYFNKRVEADVEVTEVQFAGGRVRKNYSVIHLRTAQD